MFKIGDVVQVKSGGPAMTVLSEGEEVVCLWFAEGSEAFHRERLPVACLESVEFEDDEHDKDDEEDEEDED